ncbi:oligopeptide-binding protein AppA precursor [Roseomonas sp. TAS13]|uniref:peptide ABC transporter substrate-binding protein n=1 Tax=Roseomonas sp. TAS13 TaxID=1926319 RepID=UPI00096724E5|nr:peptide ABC transporter substrate-binding protein [Roseomonas sp. TAS13]USQ74199.1 peptide ABC transporter substrate-binding protein [Roseomonas mucosa]GAV34825.1 oligopeptide-binding protein AppA precursor [Roseomonas sp. TAS13]
MRSKLEQMLEQVRHGALSRRSFVRRLVTAGLTAPMATQLLALGGVAQAQTPADAYKPTKAGGGGTLKLLWWQAPTLLNPHFAVGTKDQDGARLFYEPLAAWDQNGELQPILAATLPSRENGGLSEDGKSVTWTLKQDVKWHDGQPFTADDVVFNWEYARDPATAATTAGSYNNITVEKIDDHAIRVNFPKPTPFWAEAFVSVMGMLIPKHVFGPYTGTKSREAPANLKPIGTGPYLFEEFRPGDLVKGVLNPHYHLPNRPYFDVVEMKGGGDAASAARAVLQTGEYHFAWNLQVEDQVLQKLEAGGKGVVRTAPGGSLERIQLNQTDPWTEVDGERSSIKTKHPILSDPAVREALTLLVDRESIQKHIYGRGGVLAVNYFTSPKRFSSPNTRYEFNIQKAIDLLEKAGWKPGAGGIRSKDGKALKFVFQTSTNGPRQQTQQIVKQACRKAGIDMDLKSVTSSVFFSSDVANPDTYPHFYTDLQMYTSGPGLPDPGRFARNFLSTEISQKENKWQGRNVVRWRNPRYDELYAQQEAELDPVKRAAIFIEMNDMVINDHVVIPLISRPSVAAASKQLVAEPSGYDSYLWNFQNWYMES